MAYRKGTHTRGLFLSAAALLTAASPAHAADQFKQTADGAGIECSVSARELTRFALVDDQFASVSKISTGTPYNDFAVTNEPVRGDMATMAEAVGSTVAKVMKAKGTWLVPTMLAPMTARDQGRAGALNPASVPKAEEAAGRQGHGRGTEGHLWLPLHHQHIARQAQPRQPGLRRRQRRIDGRPDGRPRARRDAGLGRSCGHTHPGAAKSGEPVRRFSHGGQRP